MSARLEHPPWQNHPALRRVFTLFPAGALRLVGGAVRDAVRGEALGDLDLATTLPPDAVAELLRKAGVTALPTGLAHGTLTALLDGHSFEITTLRRDVQTDGRHARVAFTDAWAVDAARRDFTCNALYADLDGRIFDPVAGLEDARAGRVRFIGDARARLREDALRGLRYFRFLGRFGVQALSPPDLAAVVADAESLAQLSGERIWQELQKILRAPQAGDALALMAQHQILRAIIPAPIVRDNFLRLVTREAACGLPDALRRLAAAFPAAEARALAERLRLSGAQRARLTQMLGAPRLPVALEPVPLRRWLYLCGASGGVDTLLLHAPEHSGLLAAIRFAQDYEKPRLPVTGEDVRRLGVPSGPRVGMALQQIEQWWAARDFRPTRSACLERLPDFVT